MKVSRFGLIAATSIVLSLAACGGGPPAGPDPDPAAPAAPSNVTVVPGPGSVTISWEHDGVDVTGFVISRQTAAVTAATATPVSTALAEVGAAERSFVDDTVEAGVAYRYAVAARGSGGLVSEPTEHVGEPVVPEPKDPESLVFELAWEAFAARGDVRSIAFDPGGTRVATGVFDSRAYVWDVEGGDAPLVLSPGSTVSALSFSPDGQVLVTGGNRLVFWNAIDGSEVRRIDLNVDPSGPREWVNDLAFSPDGESVAIASDSGYVRIYSVETGEPLQAIDVGAGAAVASVLHTPSDAEPRYVVIDDAEGVQRTSDGRVALADVRTSAATRVLSVAFSPDGSKVASGSADGGVSVWNALTGEATRSLAGFTFTVTAVRFSPDGTAIAAAGGGGSSPVIIWTEATGTVERSIDALAGVRVTDIAFAPVGERLTGVGDDGHAFVWDLVADEAERSWQAHGAAVNAVAFDASGTRIATAGGWKDGRATVWEASSATELASWQHEGNVVDVAFSPDGSQVVAGASDGMLSAWQADTGVESYVSDEAAAVRRIAYDPSGDRVAVADRSHITIVDGDTGALLVRFQAPTAIASLTFDADGSRIAIGLFDRSIHVLDAATGDGLMAIADAHAEGQIETVAFTPDGDELVSGVGYVSGGAEFAVWNSVSGAEIERLDANTHGVFAIAFADDGAVMLTGGRSSIMVWDTATWENVRQIPIADTASSLVVDEDIVIVSGWGMPSVLFLERETGAQVGSIPGASGNIDYDAASGRLVLADGATVQVWEVSTP